MRKVNVSDVAEESWESPTGKFAGGYKGISIALGRIARSTDLKERHPFDVELCRVPPGKKNFPYHSHSAQFEFYLVVSGAGRVRHENGTQNIGTGDAFLFKPGEAHQIINDGEADLLFM